MCIEKNIIEIKNKIERACIKCGRSPDEITLVAVSKTFSVLDIAEAYNCEVINFGENKAQELSEKLKKIDRPIKWHFIGHLQTNKVKKIIGQTCLIHSVDSVELAKEIQRLSVNKNIVTNVLLQINISQEKTKFGINKEDIVSLLEEVKLLNNIKIKGLMTIAPNIENNEVLRNIFKKLKIIYDDISKKYNKTFNIEFEHLSMGMSNDFELAIEEGSNMIRIGHSIFGNRDYLREGE